MIGNDIVDLEVSAAESNWRRNGFLKKLFSDEELEIINDSQKPDVFVWLLWAMKESAYKAHHQEFNLPRKFNPKEFSCKLHLNEHTFISGDVTIGDKTYFTNSSVTKKYIYCYAVSSKNMKINQKILEDSKDVKQELIASFSKHYKLPKNRIKLRKNYNSIPSICYGNQEIFCNLSITHHGKFSAYIFELIN